MRLGLMLSGVFVQGTLLLLKQIPVLGPVIDFGLGLREIAKKAREEQDRHELELRVQQLEELAALSPKQMTEQVRQITINLRAKGTDISPEVEKAAIELMSALPAQARAATRATIELARRSGTAPVSVLPVDPSRFKPDQREDFFAELLPTRRPRFESGKPVPYASPGWQIEELLGSGGFGEVWRARHRDFQRDWALKFCLEKSDSLSLKREAEALLALTRQLAGHENIVALQDLNLQHEPYWLAFDYVAGGTLDDWIRSKPGERPWNQVSGLFAGILQGVAAAHEQGIVHRDLKPANILLSFAEDGQTVIPKIGDFGLGRILAAQSQSQNQKTMRGYGTQGYMSPEQRKGQPADPADDVYALAVIALQMLKGSSREQADYPERSLRALKSPPPEAVIVTLRNSIQNPRSERPANALELLSLLRDWLPQRSASTQGRSSSQFLRAAAGPEEALRARLLAVVAEHRGEPPSGAEFSLLFAQLGEEGIATGYRPSHVEQLLREAVVLWKSQETERAATRKRQIASHRKTLTELEVRCVELRKTIENLEWEDATQGTSIQVLPDQASSLLSDRIAWNDLQKSQPQLQDRVIALVGRKLGTDYKQGETRIFECGGQSHRLGSFEHRPTGVSFNLVPGGRFTMGSSQWDQSKPPHEVLVKPLLVGITPVTQAQWDRIGGVDERKWHGETLPIEGVSWDDIQAWLAQPKLGGRIALPTEAEWEYFCRAGTKTAYSFGDNDASLKDFAWYDQNSGKTTKPVAGKKPNAFGLYDVHGNVWEWCQDNWHANYNGAPTDGSAWTTGGDASERVLRGGGWSDVAGRCRSAYRSGISSSDRDSRVGFRLCVRLG